MPLGFFLCNCCGKSFASNPSVQNHQNQLTSNCWKNYSILLQAEPASSSNPDTNGNVHLLPSMPMPLSPSASAMVDAMDPMYVIEMDGANDPSNDQYPEQNATIPHTELFPGASEIYGKGKTYMDLFDDDEYVEN